VLLDLIDLTYRRVMERRYGFHPRSPQELPPDLLPEMPVGRRPVRRRAAPHADQDEQEPAPRRAQGLTAYLPHVHPPGKLKKGQRRRLRVITRTERPTK
jgi:hypothetical protein